MDYYQQNHQRLIKQYDSQRAEDIHAVWLEFLPSIPGHALDIGAGSGRDARWLNNLGWEVTAIEPCTKLREHAQQTSPKEIHWLNDSIPGLNLISRHSYNLILISAVWMHLTPSEQGLAYQRVSSLLSQNGLLVITWRNPDNDSKRPFEYVDKSLLRGATIIESNDKSGRENIRWKSAIITKLAK